MKLTFEERAERVGRFKPIDDAFFEVLARDKGVCEEILRVILEDPKLTVHEVHVQDSVKNLYGRSVRLDALCTLGDGKKANIEVQKADNDDHLRRVRYNASCITANITDPGDKFEDVPTVYVIYISKFDMFEKGKTIYHIDKHIRETGEVIDDGLYEIFVNTKIDDGTDIAELMKCFLQKKPVNPKFPAFSEQVKFLKGTKEGVGTVCKVMEDYAKEYAEEYAEQCIKEEKEKIILTALDKGNDPKTIAKIMNVPLSMVEKIQESKV